MSHLASSGDFLHLDRCEICWWWQLLTKIIFTKSFHYVVVVIVFSFAGFTHLWGWK